jgi:ketosteroid isomerase-like protein
MKKRFACLACALVLAGCVNQKVEKMKFDKAVVEQRLQRYAQLTLAMDTAGMAAMFAPEGELVNPKVPALRGRDAIAKFLAGYSDYKVLAVEDVATSTLIDGDTSEQLGTYRQKVRAPDGQIFEATGRLEINWVHTAPGVWLILQLATFPAN